LALNGSDFTNNPWDTVFDPFTDLFGSAFYIIPIGFIAVALYIKTRSPLVSSVWILSSSLLMSAGNIFTDRPSVMVLYVIFTGIGIVGTIVSVFFMRKV